MPRIALNLATIKPFPLGRKLQVARDAGYQGVGLWLAELEQVLAGGAKLSDLTTVLGHLGLRVSELCSVGGWMLTEGKQHEAALEQARQAFRVAEFLGADCVVATPALGEGSLAEAQVDFAELCRAAQPFGCRVGLEFAGQSECVADLATAWQVVAGADMTNGGLVIDSFHFYQGRSVAREMINLPVDRIFLVQMSDCIDLPREELRDRDRVFPGMGAIPLPELVGALHNLGYQGWWSLELHNEQYWQTDPFIVAQDGWHALRRLDVAR